MEEEIVHYFSTVHPTFFFFKQVVVIRRLMTEILLEVTTEEIKTAASEAYTQRLRGKSKDFIKSLVVHILNFEEVDYN